MSDTIKLLSQLINELPMEKRALLAGMLNVSAEPMAIIGIGCRFPGGANSPEAFWQTLKEGVDAISKFPADRNTDALTGVDCDIAVKMAARWGGFLEQVDKFDANFFGIAPREAVYMDPQQRLLLEVAWEALENAGQAIDNLAGSPTGVFVGVCTSDYLHFHIRSNDRDHLDPYTTSGTAHSIVANRLSYLLDFRGPSVAVDTACSSSLVAVHLACQSLRNRECRLALAGGVNLMLSPEPSLAFSRLGMLASDGRCKTFDSQADGYVRGEGCGVVVLKRLSDAMADGDPILALVRGSAVNQDGHSNGLTAPNVLAQEAVIRQALRNASVSPEQIGYIEAHGTGTSLGDPIETEALTSVLGRTRSTHTACLLGSVKTNIGHLEAAAGIAGLIKTVLALHHEEIPPHLHLRTLNPNISLTNTPLAIPTKAQSWPGISERRFAGVSAFGFGGTNAHIVLEEAPQPARTYQGDETSLSDSAYLLPISARSPEALQALAQAHYRLLLSDTKLRLDDLCFTASVRRSHHKHRLALVAHSRDELISSLAAWLHDPTHPATSDQSREEALQTLIAGGHTGFLEIGPQETLPPAKPNVHQHQGPVQASPREAKSAHAVVVEALGTLYTHGYAINWSLLYPDGGYCLSLPSYPWQRKRFWIEREHITAESTVSQTDTNEAHSTMDQRVDTLPSGVDWIYELRWQPIEQKPSARSHRHPQEDAQGDWLILSDSRGVGQALARQLEAQGKRCVLVFPGRTFERSAPDTYQLNPASPEDFKRLLADIYVERPPCSTIVHLWSLEAPAPEEMLDPSLDTHNLSSCESVLHLLHAIPQVKWAASPHLWLVTCGAQPVEASTPLSMSQAPVWGMGRTAALEYANLWGGMVDLDPQVSPEISAAQLGEALWIGVSDGEDQLAFREGLCYTLRLFQGQNSAAPRPMPIRADGSYLITGGLGAIGIKVAFWLVEHGAKHLVLLGRTGLPNHVDEMTPNSEIIKRVEAVSALEARGVQVRVAEADVSDIDQMRRVFESIVRSEHPLLGIIHSAGISVSQTIGNLDTPTLRAVLQPKVKGSWVLHQLSQDMELDFFVLFSSASAVWGSPQLAAYTAANLFLDALAHTRRAHGLPALSINWGLWAESGMVSRKIEEVISKAGVLPMQARPALDALEYLLGTEAVQAIIAQVDWQVFIPTYETGRKQPLLEYLGATMSKQSEPLVARESELVSRLQQVTYEERQALLEQHVQEEFNKVMGFEPSTSFEREQSLFELGMDSLMALQLENRLERSLEKSFPATVPFDYPTIATLARCLNDWCFD
jgi:acyl transferase domain-containing protein/acyl carrier protein